MSALLLGTAVTVLVLSAGRAGPAPRALAPGPARAWTPAWAIAGMARLADRVRPTRRARTRDRMLPDALDRLASALRAGQSIGPALGDLASQVDEPLRADLHLVGRALHRGAPVAAALEGWGSAPGASADVRLAVAALSLGAQAGGEVARAVDRIAATLRERRELHDEVRALATQARASATVLGVAPLAFAALVATVEPRAATFLVTSPIGVVCLVGGVVLEGTGALWMARITRERPVKAAVLGLLTAGLVAHGLDRSRLTWSSAHALPRPGRRQRQGATAAILLVAALVSPVLPVLAVVVWWTRRRLAATRRRHARARAVRRALPSVVDLLALASTAGLSLPVALPLVAAHAPPPMGGALAAAHADTAAGRPRADALLEHLAPYGERSRALAQVLVDHLRYGVPLLPALERTGLELRLDRRRAAEVEARRVPVRLLGPLVACVLPAFGLLTVVPLLAASLDALPT